MASDLLLSITRTPERQRGEYKTIFKQAKEGKNYTKSAPESCRADTTIQACRDIFPPACCCPQGIHALLEGQLKHGCWDVSGIGEEQAWV